MKRCISLIFLLCMLATGCHSISNESDTSVPDSSKTDFPDGNGEQSTLTMTSTGPMVTNDPIKTSILNSYYAAQQSPAFAVFKSSIGAIVKENGWTDDISASIQDAFGDQSGENGIKNPVFQFDTFARYYMLDHDWEPVYRHEQTELYYCTFTADNNICGFVVVSYDGASMELFRLWKTDYLYDLRANYDSISAGLSKTDIDLTSAQASRVGLQDTKRNRGDTIIRFVDGKGDNYVCYFGDTLETEKFKPRR